MTASNEQETRYADIQRVIHNVLDRDGQHEWDETSRLTEVIAPAVWNEIHTFPLAHERSAGAAPLDVERLAQAMDSYFPPPMFVKGVKVRSAWTRAPSSEAPLIAAEYSRLSEGTDR